MTHDPFGALLSNSKMTDDTAQKVLEAWSSSTANETVSAAACSRISTTVFNATYGAGAADLRAAQSALCIDHYPWARRHRQLDLDLRFVGRALAPLDGHRGRSSAHLPGQRWPARRDDTPRFARWARRRWNSPRPGSRVNRSSRGWEGILAGIGSAGRLQPPRGSSTARHGRPGVSPSGRPHVGTEGASGSGDDQADPGGEHHHEHRTSMARTDPDLV